MNFSQSQNSNLYPYPSFEKDLNLMIQSLLDYEVFTVTQGRKHASFQFEQGLLEEFKMAELKKWIKSTVSKAIMQLTNVCTYMHIAYYTLTLNTTLYIQLNCIL